MGGTVVILLKDGEVRPTSGLSGKRVNPWCATDGLMRYNQLNQPSVKPVEGHTRPVDLRR